jgi:hypothetical protein
MWEKKQAIADKRVDSHSTLHTTARWPQIETNVFFQPKQNKQWGRREPK